MFEVTETDQTYRNRATALVNMLVKRPERHDQDTFGTVRPQNECGTVACIAGWAALWSRGRVNIALDGDMTWAALRQVEEYDEDTDTDVMVGTLYDSQIVRHAFLIGADWLGLTTEAANCLFWTMNESLALEMLRRLGDGRLGRDFDLDDLETVENWMEAEDSAVV